MSNEQIDGNNSQGYLYDVSSTDIVQEQTRHRLRAENATWRQQQASAARMRRAEWICAGVIVLAILTVVGIEMARAWRLR